MRGEGEGKGGGVGGHITQLVCHLSSPGTPIILHMHSTCYVVLGAKDGDREGMRGENAFNSYPAISALLACRHALTLHMHSTGHWCLVVRVWIERNWQGGEQVTQLVCHLSSSGTPLNADCAHA